MPAVQCGACAGSEHVAPGSLWSRCGGAVDNGDPRRQQGLRIRTARLSQRNGVAAGSSALRIGWSAIYGVGGVAVGGIAAARSASRSCGHSSAARWAT